MADTKKKITPGVFTHWARPRVRTYEYNYEYGESYYRPLVKYISTSRASSYSASSSSCSVDSRRMRFERRRRAASPPGALSFIERWSYEPFYGYGIGFRSRQSLERTSTANFQSSLSSSTESAIAASRAVRAQSVIDSSRSIRARSASRSARAQSVAAVQQSSLSSSALSSLADIRSERARSLEAAYNYASDDCLMRSTALRSARAASQEIMNTSSLTNRTLVLDDKNILHGRTLDERYYLDYPKQHLVCPLDCPLHNSPEWRRRFLIGNRFLDAAALGGFDVLYDPSVYKNSRRLLAKLAERSESESEEVLIERSSESESSKRRIRAASYFA